MDHVAVISLALTLAFQARWQEEQRDDRRPVQTTSRSYTREDAIALGRRFGSRTGHKKPTPGTAGNWLLHHVDAVAREIQRYESPRLQELALNAISFDTLNAQASRIEESEALDYQDALVQALVEWAKNDFLKWADPIRCSACGGATEGVAGGLPTDDERNDGAGRVELYRCNNDSPCKGHITRFPRYTSLSKLLQTRIGRCGEFAAVFMLLLRSLNIRARYIWNSEDHVWNEYYSDALRRWVHVDSCEDARDKNLLYDQGWGKKMKYCIAFGVDGVKDVTRSYISDWQETLLRRDSSLETSLRNRLQQITESLRQRRSEGDLISLREEDRLEEEWLSNTELRAKLAQNESLSGRTSGTKEWRAMRAELGGATSLTGMPTMIPLDINASSDQNINDATVNGSAKVDVTNGQIILTEDKPDQIASAFLSLPADLQELIFTCTFSISHQRGEGADGMAIVFHSDPHGSSAIGRGGCDLGYGGLENCLAVEIDTYRSVDRCADPPTPHISVHTGGIRPVSAHHRDSLWCSKPGGLPDLDSGQLHTLRIELSRPRKELRIFFTDGAEQDDFVEISNGPIDLSALPNEPYKFIGWTAATGGLHQRHVIVRYELRSGQTREDVL